MLSECDYIFPAGNSMAVHNLCFFKRWAHNLHVCPRLGPKSEDRKPVSHFFCYFLVDCWSYFDSPLHSYLFYYPCSSQAPVCFFLKYNLNISVFIVYTINNSIDCLRILILNFHLIIIDVSSMGKSWVKCINMEEDYV